MGLDSVELVMAVEERFGIAIDDAEAVRLLTPGLLIDYVMSKVGYTDRAQCLTQRAFHRLRASLMRQFGLKRGHIKPETPLAELFPRKGRQASILKLLADLGITRPIELVRPGWLQTTIAALIFGGGAAVWFRLAMWPDTPSSYAYAAATNSPGVTAIFLMVSLGWIPFSLTQSLRVEFKPNLQTVGHLSRWVSAYGPGLASAPPGEWNREQISAIIREVVIEQLGCEKNYREEARFIEDLGVD